MCLSKKTCPIPRLLNQRTGDSHYHWTKKWGAGQHGTADHRAVVSPASPCFPLLRSVVARDKRIGGGPIHHARLTGLERLTGPSAPRRSTSWVQPDSALFRAPSGADIRADLLEPHPIVAESVAFLINNGAQFRICIRATRPTTPRSHPTPRSYTECRCGMPIGPLQVSDTRRVKLRRTRMYTSDFRRKSNDLVETGTFQTGSAKLYPTID